MSDRPAATAYAVPAETLAVFPPDPADNEFAEVVRRARVLHPPLGPLSPQAPVHGDDGATWRAQLGDGRPLRQAAVLLALTADDGGRLSIILTERASHLSVHAGQIALPGGKLEQGETPAAAALREAEEEVALPGDALEPLGLADSYVTRTGFSIVPVLARLRRPATLRPHPGEVAAAFTAPWSHVMSAEHRKEIAVEHEGVTRRIYETMYGERRIWGATAAILKLVNDRLYRS